MSSMAFIALVGFIIFILGASIGSFAAAAVCRMQARESIVFVRSHCPNCGYHLGIFDLFPIFSFIFLGGKCKKCKAGIELSDFLAEIIFGVLFLYAFFSRWTASSDANTFSLMILRDWIFLGGLGFLFLYDFKYKILPDKVTIPLGILLLLYNLSLGAGWLDLLLGVAVGGGFFLLQYLVSRGKWVGDGDIRMGALLGAGLGFRGVVLALLLAYFMGAIASIYLLIKKKVCLKSEIAFGTFLAIGGAIALFWGEKIIGWYWNLLK